MISVCMATFNGAAFITQQVQSILDQLGERDELIISDDGSSDGTVDILRGIGDRRLQILQFGDKNLIKNFENALRKASGDFIFLSDQDDIWKPSKIKISMAALENGASLVVSDCTVIDEHGEVLADSIFKLKPPREGLVANLYKNSFMGCCMAFNKSVLQKALPFPSTIPMHDSWIGTVALASGEPVLFLRDKLVLYRRHDGALSSTGEKSTAPFAKQLADRVNLVSRLALRRLGLA